jgi:hypothetical protein
MADCGSTGRTGGTLGFVERITDIGDVDVAIGMTGTR